MVGGMRRLARVGTYVLIGLGGCGDDNASQAPGTETTWETGGSSPDPDTAATSALTNPVAESTTFGTEDDETGGTSDATAEASTSSAGPTSSDPTSAGPTSSDPSSTTSAGPTSSGPTSTTSAESESTTSASASAGESTSPSEGSSTGDSTSGGEDAFSPVQPFGDNVQESDLIGVWNLHWDPVDRWDSELSIDDTGNFIWTETSSDCSEAHVASGVLWVEGTQVVMHVDAWDGPLPWPTMDALERSFHPPFRMRLSFTLQGSGSDVYLAFSGPDGLTRTEPYDGQSYVQVATAGEHLGGEWRGEAELIAVYEGVEAEVIVRDVSTAYTDAENDADAEPLEGAGTWARVRTFYPVPSAASIFANFNWTCLNGCTEPAGTTFVAGTDLYTYGPYAGYRHLMTFESGRTFRRDILSDCD